ncbi:MAG: ParA family protein, partial [Armatimonadetes bacterium]|nr:ParA family protein [Armatimonadota bacterium]
MRTIAFFNSSGGVGNTSLVYHLSYMFAELDIPTLAADLDPQANLTSMFLPEERLEELWPDDGHPLTVSGAVRPLLDGTGDISPPHVERVRRNLYLLPGDLELAGFEDDLSSQWPLCLDRKPRPFLVISAFWRLLESAAAAHNVDVVLIDVGPNRGAINRAALIAAQHVVVPLAPDLYSLQGLRNLGLALREWRSEWSDRLPRRPDNSLSLPAGEMQPVGYVVLQHAVRSDRPVRAYERWMRRIPEIYHREVLGQSDGGTTDAIETDPECLATLRHYRSLMPMAQEARYLLNKWGLGGPGAPQPERRGLGPDQLRQRR